MSDTPFFKTDCPSCGAPVEAHSATAVTLVCGYCNSMLVRRDNSIIDTGRDSALLEDFSPLQIGTSGRFAARGFTLVGRLQVRYDSGVWNEWYALFDDGSSGWLSEAGDLYVMTQQGVIEQAPEFAETRAGFSTLTYQDKQFVAADVREVSFSQAAAQGELPFAVSDGMSNRVSDWRCEHLFLTLDYATNPPEAFIGRTVKLADLSLSNTRTDEQIRTQAGRLKGERCSENCPNCGSPVHWLSGLTPHLICSSCGSELDVSESKAKLMAANAMRQSQQSMFALLGKQGRLNNREYYVMGAVRYGETDAQDTFEHLFNRPRTLVPQSWWNEYLLYHPQHGFSWLVQTADGEWSISETLNDWPRLNRNGQPQGCNKMYDYGGQVQVAAGAFYWHIRHGDTNYYSDYRLGSGKICAELSRHELAWSKSIPIPYAQVAAAFGLNQAQAPKYTAVMRADGVSMSLRLILLAIFIVVNIPAWLAMLSDGLLGDSVIPSLVSIGFIMLLGRNSDEE